MKEYEFSYRFGGKAWSISIWANSPDEAKEKIKAVAHAEYDGEILTRVYVPVKQSWVSKVLSWFR